VKLFARIRPGDFSTPISWFYSILLKECLLLPFLQAILMWKSLSFEILRNRTIFVSILLALTAFLGYEASKIEMSYEFAKVLPDSDSTSLEYTRFKNLFGEDGSVMVAGFNDKDFFKKDKFNDWYRISKEIKKIKGIQDVLSVANLYKITKDDSLEKLLFKPVVTRTLRSQAETDSIKNVILSLPFYEGLMFNKESNTYIIAITFNKRELNSSNRLEIVKTIKDSISNFGAKYGIEMHYSGMPFIRSEMMRKVRSEMKLFMSLALLVTAIILWLFFRTLSSVFFSLITTGLGVICTLGILHLFSYKITILSGLIPPLIIVIGVPNCIFLINKYQGEYSLHGNKMKALARTIQTMGISLFLANVTTAIGFGVLYFTNTALLVEFGTVSAIGVMVTYIITVILIPIILSLLPAPSTKSRKHLEGKRINKLLTWIDHLVHNRRKVIYLSIAAVTAISVVGMLKVNVLGYVVDDLPQKDPLFTDLKFFEKHVKGVLPFEIFIDTKKEGGVFSENAKTLYKINALQKLVNKYEAFSKPLSVTEGIKFSYQALRGGEQKFYRMPPIGDLSKLNEYSANVKGQENKLQHFVDDRKRYTRVSYQMADIGSDSIEKIVQKLRPQVDSIFPPIDYNVEFTGHSLVFLKGNSYLLHNLFESLLIEIILVTAVGLALFRSLRVIILSKLPVLIPLVVTAGIMGFMDVRFKPSTILIFSIAFGISSDGTIYFLTKYRHELKQRRKSVSQAISTAIHETGLSMIYTAIILFSGFAIFSASSFGGTAALGILVSITLLVSMCTNLVLLPAILLSIDKRRSKKELLRKPLIDLEEPADTQTS
jgi:uncharacterized protein